jgi:hypothetical protein
MKWVFAGSEEPCRWKMPALAERFDAVRRAWTHENVENFQRWVESGMQE